jgi:DNA uptake protein ComE-like DNA-binding protein
MDPHTSAKTPDQPNAPTLTPLDQLPRIGAPATRALAAAGYTKLGEFADVPRGDLLKVHGVGPKALQIIDEALGRHGLGLG